MMPYPQHMLLDWIFYCHLEFWTWCPLFLDWNGLPSWILDRLAVMDGLAFFGCPGPDLLLARWIFGCPTWMDYAEDWT